MYLIVSNAPSYLPPVSQPGAHLTQTRLCPLTGAHGLWTKVCLSMVDAVQYSQEMFQIACWPKEDKWVGSDSSDHKTLRSSEVYSYLIGTIGTSHRVPTAWGDSPACAQQGQELFPRGNVLSRNLANTSEIWSFIDFHQLLWHLTTLHQYDLLGCYHQTLLHQPFGKGVPVTESLSQ